MNTTGVFEWLDTNERHAIDDLISGSRIPSVGTDPAHHDDCDRAAQWAADHLTTSGFRAQLMPTGTPDAPGRPIVLATSDPDPDYNGPHVLFYGHYDVNPPTPSNSGTLPPSNPSSNPRMETSENASSRAARAMTKDRS